MKNIAALIMLTFWAVTGYYVGAAVAMNHNPAENKSEPVGVMVVEEEYGVVAAPDTQNQQPAAKNDSHNKNQKHDTKNQNPDNNGTFVEEIDEMETVE